MSKIMIVEDDDNIRELECYALNSSGFETLGFSDGKELFAEMKNEIPKLLILDIMLPGDDGITILKNMKTNQKLKDIPVIILTAKNSELDRVRGLDLGADDYMTKPFSVLELISRVKAILRRCEPKTEEIQKTEVQKIQMKDLIIDPTRWRVTVKNEEITLTFKEFELLLYLANNQGIVLSRDKIMETIWGFDFEGESRTVDMHIKTLRQKLRSSCDIIKTVRNVGYKIEECDVESK